MSGLFISYRRTDVDLAEKLVLGLRLHLGPAHVFMDRNGIDGGADFPLALTNALDGCDALLAIIGPTWATVVGGDGRRRLEVPEDWVRREIVHVLARKVPVFPVLVRQAQPVAEKELPDDLQAFHRFQAWAVSDQHWDDDVIQLVEYIVKATPLKMIGDVGAVARGIQKVKKMIGQVPQVAEAVSRAREVIENTQRQLDRLELFKTLHDCLHTIELQCLIALQSAQVRRPRPFKVAFDQEAHRIEQALRSHEDVNPGLKSEIEDGLETTGAAFRALVEQPSDANHAEVVGELSRLISGLPSQLDLSISDAARELRLDRFVGLMKDVRDILQQALAAPPADLEQLREGIDSLQRLHEDLRALVDEHAHLQRLDIKLRSVCVELVPERVGSEWKRVKQVLSRLVPPFSPQLQDARQDLAEQEQDVDAALDRLDVTEAAERIAEYFRSVGAVFRSVDTELKDFCLRLSEVNQPLKSMLGMV